MLDLDWTKVLVVFFRLDFPRWKRTGIVLSGSGGQHLIFWRLAGKQHVLLHPVQKEEDQSGSTFTSKGTDERFARVLVTFSMAPSVKEGSGGLLKISLKLLLHKVFLCSSLCKFSSHQVGAAAFNVFLLLHG